MSAHGGYYEQDYADPTARQANILRAHRRDALELPHPDEEIRFGELVDMLHGGASTAKQFSQHGIVEQKRRVTPNKSSSKGHIWGTNPDVFGWIVDNLTRPDETPCGNATGIRTVEAGKVYTCTDEDCNCRFDRHIAEEVVD